MDKLAVVIPTFNESANLSGLVNRLKKVLSANSLIVIVDDNSPDGTGKVADKIAKYKKSIIVVHRNNKGGRGSAVLEGFKTAKKFNPSYYVEMDADFSHRPQDVARLVSIASKKTDVVVGSRYLEGSKIVNWPLQRKIFSKLSNVFARAILNVPISDYTNGFRIYSKAAATFILSQNLTSSGYIVLSETAFKLNNAGFSFAEIPIVFVNRKRGHSNTNIKEIMDAFIGIIRIRIAG